MKSIDIIKNWDSTKFDGKSFQEIGIFPQDDFVSDKYFDKFYAN